MSNPRTIAAELARAYPEFRALVFDEDWRERALCRNAGPFLFFADPKARPSTRANREAAACRFCRGCEVRGSCLADALSRPGERGVWGGQTEDDREVTARKLRRVRVRLRSVSDACYDEPLEAVSTA